MNGESKINIYECPCKHRTITVDLLKGTTPFIIKCREDNCIEFARSYFYEVDQTLTPSHEWYKPNEKEYMSLEPATKEHVDMGGLLLRKINNNGK